ncbi:hypothetical protein AtNW77_Chr5g0102581 [Arabidopsis thaliana]|uniref:Uncharacterized protein n=3 Tax=Arabidopsis TaxID=3701 RepID=A0A178ULA8_ARATH|nr:uncharacterized protein AT5G18404 [Arabidopsis thaliana]KAG7602695.1 hypothetical protein ISN45_At05g017350 [Arabidopsis thaliana x Arabidopsis arenosa]AED92554.1 hypothetical protein AT5G18404 [Arabidopsis thaliana]OAO94330.1 hypothetical protein AXX17_AT5G18190 [Arabidopsis thaliana]CAA0403412.1 unnamed protein product [Arabidopsis thaliana]VYS67225.1 unnamed protein product [Arabidopsis thaliana]|eukprot:NP_001119247.1 hypothetical protein AT5G18404 [Arabidopsis thaliana]
MKCLSEVIKVSKADTSFSNLICDSSARLCLMAQAVLSSRGQRALSMEKIWLFSRPIELSSSLPTNRPDGSHARHTCLALCVHNSK